MTHIEEDYVANLQLLFKKYSEMGKYAGTNPRVALNQDAGGGDSFTNFLQDVANGDFPGAHQTLSQFLEQMINLPGTWPGGTFNFDTDKELSAGYQALLGYFKSVVGISTAAGAPSTDLGDWEPLRELLSEDPNNVMTANEFAEKNMEQAFDHFISNFPFSNSITGASFIHSFEDFLTIRASLVTDIVGSAGEIGTDKNITSYHDLYFQFVPGATEEGYKTTLQTFYKDTVAQEGYFLPSQHLSKWFDVVKATKEVVTAPIRSTESAGFQKTTIIFELLRLVESMIGTLQQVASSQANRLTFYANAQKAYTDMIEKVPIIRRDQIVQAVNGPSDEEINSLVQQISSINDAYTESLRSYRSVLGDEAKQHQTVVNQTKEATDQQGDLATAILQQLSSLLTAIFPR